MFVLVDRSIYWEYPMLILMINALIWGALQRYFDVESRLPESS